MSTKGLGIWRGLILFGLTMALPVGAQIFTSLHDFAGQPTDGSSPGGVMLTNGVLYGSAMYGGSANSGMIFSFSTNAGANFTILHDFTDDLDGVSPNDLISDGTTLYGTTHFGGTNNAGTVFRIKIDGSNYTNLWSFAGRPDGAIPSAGLVLRGVTLYGTTSAGGSNDVGTVFKIGVDGKNYSLIHHFSPSLSEGQTPLAGLVMNDVTLYGTTSAGGSNDVGTVFKLVTNGLDFAIVHTFTNSPDGAEPEGVLAFNNNLLYGTTLIGGNGGAVNGTLGSGTIFRMSTNGANFDILHNFPNTPYGTNAEGAHLVAGLLVNGDIIYGTAANGGSTGGGTIFQLSTNGSGFLVIKDFTNTPDGANPTGGLALDGKTLYGMTGEGGDSGNGLAYGLFLSPAITSQPQDLTVTNGDPFSFVVNAAGAPALGYQWYYQTNTALADATNPVMSYVSSTPDQAGAYSVVVTNFYGSVTSSVAILTVVIPSAITTSPVILNYGFDPADSSFTLSASNTVGSTNRLWATTNLSSPDFWRVIATNVMSTNGLWNFTDTNVVQTNTIQFYRFSTP